MRSFFFFSIDSKHLLTRYVPTNVTNGQYTWREGEGGKKLSGPQKLRRAMRARCELKQIFVADNIKVLLFFRNERDKWTFSQRFYHPDDLSDIRNFFNNQLFLKAEKNSQNFLRWRNSQLYKEPTTRKQDTTWTYFRDLWMSVAREDSWLKFPPLCSTVFYAISI